MPAPQIELFLLCYKIADKMYFSSLRLDGTAFFYMVNKKCDGIKRQSHFQDTSRLSLSSNRSNERVCEKNGT